VQKRQLMDMLSLHSASCVKNNNSNTRQSPTTPYNMIRPYESPTTFPTSFETSPYIRPESANILASSYTCITPINNDSSIDTVSSLDAIYAQPQIVDEYNRPDSVLSLPPNSEANYTSTDGFLPKATNLLVPMDTEQEYYDPEVNYTLPTTQQCHTYPGTLSDAQTKLNNGLNDGCLV
jgi:hypothetical protein